MSGGFQKWSWCIWLPPVFIWAHIEPRWRISDQTLQFSLNTSWSRTRSRHAKGVGAGEGSGRGGRGRSAGGEPHQPWKSGNQSGNLENLEIWKYRNLKICNLKTCATTKDSLKCRFEMPKMLAAFLLSTLGGPIALADFRALTLNMCYPMNSKTITTILEIWAFGIQENTTHKINSVGLDW